MSLSFKSLFSEIICAIAVSFRFFAVRIAENPNMTKMQVIKVAAAKIIIFVASVIWFVLTFDPLSAERCFSSPPTSHSCCLRLLLFTPILYTMLWFRQMISNKEDLKRKRPEFGYIYRNHMIDFALVWVVTYDCCSKWMQTIDPLSSLQVLPRYIAIGLI